jgi:hypothetical protein
MPHTPHQSIDVHVVTDPALLAGPYLREMGRHPDARPRTFAAWEIGSGGPVTATAIRNRQQFYDRWIGGRTTEWLVRSNTRRKIAAVIVGHTNILTPFDTSIGPRAIAVMRSLRPFLREITRSPTLAVLPSATQPPGPGCRCEAVSLGALVEAADQLTGGASMIESRRWLRSACQAVKSPSRWWWGRRRGWLPVEEEAALRIGLHGGGRGTHLRCKRCNRLRSSSRCTG